MYGPGMKRTNLCVMAGTGQGILARTSPHSMPSRALTTQPSTSGLVQPSLLSILQMFACRPHLYVHVYIPNPASRAEMRRLMLYVAISDNWAIQDPDFPRTWIEAHEAASAALGKPLVLEEVGTLPYNAAGRLTGQQCNIGTSHALLCISWRLAMHMQCTACHEGSLGLAWIWRVQQGVGVWQPLPAACLQMHSASIGRNCV